MENHILHVDMNNFYASVETLFHPEYRDVPMAVAGDEKSRHGIILAKNMAAKALGVRTAEPIREALRKCPELILAPPHHERYAYYSARAKAIYCEYTDRVESFGLDECWLDVAGSERLFGPAETIAQTIRARIRQELGLTVSIGVSFNKVFAKLGSDYKKPDAVTVFGRAQMETIIWKLPCDALLFVGPSTRRVLDRLGIYTIGDLAKMPRTVLGKRLGKAGDALWRYANGLDDSPVRLAESREPAKTIGNSVTLPQDLRTEQEVRETLLSLAETVAARLREEGLRAGEVQLTVRDSDFGEVSRQGPLEPPACDSRSLYEKALELYRREKKHRPVRLLGLRAGDLTDREGGQVRFFGEPGRERREKLEDALDALRARFGKDSVAPAMILGDKGGRSDGRP